VTLRSPATQEELEACFALRREVLGVVLERAGASPTDDREKDAFHILALDGNVIVGSGRLHHIDTHTAQIRYMVVKRTSRGQGIGGKILERLENHARLRGVASITLNAHGDAVGFYEKHGYLPKLSGSRAADPVPCVEMTKGL
jgi:predicted GNAT family N-acyltransferase